MRYMACFILLCVSAPAIAEEKLRHDFRGAKFDNDLLAYSGLTPEKYLTPENEGLRLRYTGADAPPSNNTSGVVWRFHARGDFVVTAKYEILKIETPRKGYGVGPELYLRLKNPKKDGVSFSRLVPPNGNPSMQVTYMTNDENGRRGPDRQASKWMATTDASMRGAFRVARQGNVLVASFADGADGDFKEFQRMDISNVDVDQIRFAGLAGGDTNAVLDLRMLEFNLEGQDLGHNGRDFATPAPKIDGPLAKGDAPAFQPGVQPPNPEPAPSSKSSLLLLVAIIFVLVIPLLVIVGVVLFLRLRRPAVAGSEKGAPLRRENIKAGVPKAKPNPPGTPKRPARE